MWIYFPSAQKKSFFSPQEISEVGGGKDELIPDTRHETPGYMGYITTSIPSIDSGPQGLAGGGVTFANLSNNEDQKFTGTEHGLVSTG
jgi:hypothetical protein